ncbi:hypothetical protein MMC17_008362 [Xylographa soralifera]|nr:hypothetical protein [Xylographa soralifera]
MSTRASRAGKHLPATIRANGPSNYNDVLLEFGAGASAYCSQATDQVALQNAQALFYQADVRTDDAPTQDEPVIGARYYLSNLQTAPLSNCEAHGLSL